LLKTDSTMTNNGNSGSKRDTCTDKMWNVVHVTKILKSKHKTLPSPDVLKIVCRMLDKREDYPIDELIDCGLVPFLVQGLNIDDNDISCLCVTALAQIIENIGKPKINKIFDAGTTAQFIRLMVHTNFEMAEDAT
ncbi:hypothetical protein PMAYCL1PPCAC_26459, partial [Pristionchus mayeri]